MRPGPYAIGLFLLAFPTHVLAHTPPIPPPDPDALAAARELVEQLPISETPLNFSVGQSVEQSNARIAVAWLDQTERDLLDDEELERLFVAEVELESRRLLPACVPEAKEALAESFSRHLSASDARDIASFLATKSGQALAPTISVDPFIETLRSCSYRALLPRLRGILSSATESNELRRRVNSRL